MSKIFDSIFSRLQPTDFALQGISRAFEAPDTFPVFVLKNQSAFEHRMLEYVLNSHFHEHQAIALKSILATNSDDITPLIKNNEWLEGANPLTVFLQGQTRPRQIEPFFSRLLDIAARHNKAVTLIPIAIIWNRYPRPIAKHSLVSGKNRHPSEFSRKLMLLLSPQNISFEVGIPIALEKSTEGEDPVEFERQIRSRLFRSLSRIERAVIGPPMRSRAQLIPRVMKDRILKEKIKELSGNDSEKIEKATQQAQKILHEMAADFRKSTVLKFKRVLDWAWPKVIEGFWIDEEGLEKYRVLSRKAPALLLPCHRSHADYLILSYVFNLHNLMLPFIAAGINLSFWPMGPIFRRSGAYFIRRSFKNDKLYPIVLEAYVRRILKEKIPQEFFPEGTRSRTGKLLHPKTGLLAINLNAVRRGDIEDLLFAPISVVYGKLFETRSYLSEAEGATKKKESASSVLKTTRLLGKNFGKVYMNFGQMFMLSEYLEAHSIQLRDMDDKEFRDFTMKVGFDIVREIQRATLVTPIALVSLLFLSNVRKGMNHQGLMRRLDYARRYFESRGIPMAELSTAVDESVMKVLNYLVEADRIQILKVDGETIYRPVDEKRDYLEYYKNNIVHHFVYVALTAAAILKLRKNSFTFDEVKREYLFLRNLLFQEFVYDTHEPTDEEIQRELDQMEALNILTRKHDLYEVESKSFFVLRNIAGVILSYLEAYYTVIESYYAIARGNDTPPPNILPSILSRGKLLYTMGEISRKESVNKFYYQTGHQWMNRSGQVNWPVLSTDLRKGLDTEETLKYKSLRSNIRLFMTAIYG